VSDDRGFRSEADPDNPGWHAWQHNDPARFNSWMFPKLLVRAESATKARLRMFPEHRHTNLGNNIHGAAVMALIDIGLFACSSIRQNAPCPASPAPRTATRLESALTLTKS